MRAFASLLGTFPSAGAPPGRELAVVLSELLTRAGQAHDGPAEEHRVAWSLQHALEGARVMCVVKLADAKAGDRWLVEVSIRKSGRARFSSKGRTGHEEALEDWCVALYEGLEDDPRADDVRWVTPEAWW